MATEVQVMATGPPTKVAMRPKFTQPVRSGLWNKFFQRCFLQRVSRKQFETDFDRLYSHHPIGGRSLVYSLLGSQKFSGLVADPLMLVYLEIFLSTRKADASQILYSLLLKSKHLVLQNPQTSGAGQKPLVNPTDLETRVFAMISGRIMGGKLPQNPEEARGILIAVTKWLMAVSNPAGPIAQGKDARAHEMVDTIGILTIAILENKRMVGIIDTASSARKPSRGMTRHY
jgi:hypothetical protein